LRFDPDFAAECKLSPTPDSGKKAVAEAGWIMVKLGTRDNWASQTDAHNAVCLAILPVDYSTDFF
jgi:hypothetical protein